MTPYGTMSGVGDYKYNDNFGARLGSVVHEGFSKLFGFGDYTVKQNSLLQMGTDPPQIRNGLSDAVVVRHREYLGDLRSGGLTGLGTSEFVLQDFSINPGNAALFPFLSNIATNFQEYEMRGMILELKSLTSEFSTNSILGSMFVGTHYNVLAPDPSTKQQIENLEYSSSSKPSTSLVHAIECARGANVDTHLYVTRDSNYQNGDPRFYDLGKIFVGSQGIPVGTAPIAEMWISYEVALYKPILQSIGSMRSALLQSSFVGTGTPWGDASHRFIGEHSYSGIEFNIVNNELIIELPNQQSSWLVNIALNVQTAIVASAGILSAFTSDANFVKVWSYGSPGTSSLNGSDLWRNSEATGQPGAMFIVDVPRQTDDGSVPSVTIDNTLLYGAAGGSDDTLVVWVTCVDPNVVSSV